MNSPNTEINKIVRKTNKPTLVWQRQEKTANNAVKA
jgi:hypothetical protein